MASSFLINSALMLRIHIALIKADWLKTENLPFTAVIQKLTALVLEKMIL